MKGILNWGFLSLEIFDGDLNLGFILYKILFGQHMSNAFCKIKKNDLQYSLLISMDKYSAVVSILDLESTTPLIKFIANSDDSFIWSRIQLFKYSLERKDGLVFWINEKIPLEFLENNPEIL